MKTIENKILIILGIIIVVGVVFFSYVLDVSFVDSLYFVITMITTVGFGDISLIHTPWIVKFIGMGMMVVGAASLAILFSMVTSRLVEYQFEKLYGRFKTKMKDHTILIGWNKTAEATLDELRKISKVTLITENKDVLKDVRYKNVHVMIGDGTDEDTLLRAKIKDAKNVITCEEDDKKNIMTVLMVKRINHKVKIISSANEVVNMKILKEAGAYEVISPDVIGGRLLTSAIFEEGVVNLIHDATFVGKGTNIEEIHMKVSASTKFITDKFRISVLEKIVNGKRYQGLKTDDMINKGETIIVFGKIENIKKAVSFLCKHGGKRKRR